MKRILALAAAGALFLSAGSAPALAADDSQAHEQHTTKVSQTRGWQEMGSNPSDMDGMMCSPPMHGAEHPGPGNPPSVTDAHDEVNNC